MEIKVNRVIYADILRVLAICFIVLLHTCGSIVYNYNSISVKWWWIGNIADSLSRWGVPVFIMISGMLLLSPAKDENVHNFLRKRLNKVFIPFLFWSIFYTVWITRSNIQANLPSYLSLFLKNFAEGNIIYHFKFFYYFLGLYVITPILRIFVKNAPKNILNYFILIWIIVNPIFSIVVKFLHINIGFSIPMVSGYIGYFVMGYYVENINIIKPYRKLLYLFSLFSIIITAMGTYYLTKLNNGILDEYFYEYLSLNVIIISVSIFSLFRNINFDYYFSQRQSILKLVNVISKTSFGIFIIHPLILNYLAVRGITGMTYNPIIGLPLTSLICFSTSFIIIYLLQKIPIVCRIVP